MKDSTIFVFGSNLAGRHGAGSALLAAQSFGAEYGVGEGPTGRAYAIPTKDGRTIRNLRDPRNILALPTIRTYVLAFVQYAKDHPELAFRVSRIGCGLAGYHDHEVAPMFRGAPDNCFLPFGWRKLCQ
jgi:hypothetical protein